MHRREHCVSRPRCSFVKRVFIKLINFYFAQASYGISYGFGFKVQSVFWFLETLFLASFTADLIQGIFEKHFVFLPLLASLLLPQINARILTSNKLIVCFRILPRVELNGFLRGIETVKVTSSIKNVCSNHRRKRCFEVWKQMLIWVYSNIFLLWFEMSWRWKIKYHERPRGCKSVGK